MKTDHWKSIIRTWTGLLAVLTAIIAAAWLLSVHIHARQVIPAEQELVESLKEKAKTDTEVQNVLQPELERQQDSLVKRRSAYNRGGLILLISAGTFFVWFRWFRPEPGEWAGIGAGMQRYMEKASAEYIQRQRCPAAQCKGTVRYRILDTCTGCALCPDECPEGAIEAKPGEQHEINDSLCTGCGMCSEVCPVDAIEQIPLITE